MGRVTYAEAMVEFALLHDQRQRLVDVLEARRTQLARRRIGEVALYVGIDDAARKVPVERRHLLVAAPTFNIRQDEQKLAAPTAAEFRAGLSKFAWSLTGYGQAVVRSFLEGYRNSRGK